MLDYVALGILIFAAVVLFYGIIVLHDIPYEIAVHRDHPHQDAIHAAGWVSLFTLHALWPFLWIWAMLYRKDRGWGFHHGRTPQAEAEYLEGQLAELRQRLEVLEGRAPAVIAEPPPVPPAATPSRPGGEG
ncbi:DUF3302 domain-containing protein [Pseudomonas sp. AU12215]|uniref:DUF3302 domain-containing protein n=1 Tax=Pseudomonas sp. AU12215 TaxID=1860123 RepID=UPI0007EE728E|nr:DUF3302 domain-containing protein [Pseudomonas sp. AU12215]OBY60844.1 hypothetical protein A9513_022790 [Pseudomonas sp. AU12215]